MPSLFLSVVLCVFPLQKGVFYHFTPDYFSETYTNFSKIRRMYYILTFWLGFFKTQQSLYLHVTVQVATKAPIPIVNFQLSIFNCLCLSDLVAHYNSSSNSLINVASFVTLSIVIALYREARQPPTDL